MSLRLHSKQAALTAFLILLSIYAFAQQPLRVEPPSWWAGMNDPSLQLLIHGKEIGNAEIKFNYQGISIVKVHRPENKNYIFVDLRLDKNVKPGKFDLQLIEDGKKLYTYAYEIKQRRNGSASRQGFTPADVIYLLMPDRFANGDPRNDSHESMIEKADRNNPSGRHGGDITGIRQHLDYIKDLGMTAVWINPLLENNNQAYTYHGYAITDFYRVDPRYGTNSDYVQLVSEAHNKGLKVIMDMVFNHCGINHWFINDLPMADWIHKFPQFTKSNFRAESLTDPHASEFDRNRMVQGWFDQNMPDLDQRNPFLTNYLIQNSIWWIEYADLDGIRMDTQPYPYKEVMAEWAKRVFNEYPGFNIVGEAWLQKESMTASYQKNAHVAGDYNSNIPSVTDFPMQGAITKAFTENEGWSEGLARLYYVLAQDFLYPDPYKNLIFADNHDLNRFFTTINKDVTAYKLAMAFLLTTRGIPMIYYGTEFLMEGEEHKGHGDIRRDFPGGWVSDTLNYFTADGRTELQNDAFNFMQTILKWRSNCDAVKSGTMKHYIPQDGVYVYFRQKDKQKVMVLLNNKSEPVAVDLTRFEEDLAGIYHGTNIISAKPFTFRKSILLEPRQPLIIDITLE